MLKFVLFIVIVLNFPRVAFADDCKDADQEMSSCLMQSVEGAALGCLYGVYRGDAKQKLGGPDYVVMGAGDALTTAATMGTMGAAATVAPEAAQLIEMGALTSGEVATATLNGAKR